MLIFYAVYGQEMRKLLKHLETLMSAWLLKEHDAREVEFTEEVQFSTYKDHVTVRVYASALFKRDGKTCVMKAGVPIKVSSASNSEEKMLMDFFKRVDEAASTDMGFDEFLIKEVE